MKSRNRNEEDENSNNSLGMPDEKRIYSNCGRGRCLITSPEQKAKYEDMKYKIRDIRYKLKIQF